MSSTYHAPRFHARLSYIEGRSVLLMSRVAWKELKLQEDKPVLCEHKFAARASSYIVDVVASYGRDDLLVIIEPFTGGHY